MFLQTVQGQAFVTVKVPSRVHLSGMSQSKSNNPFFFRFLYFLLLRPPLILYEWISRSLAMGDSGRRLKCGRTMAREIKENDFSEPEINKWEAFPGLKKNRSAVEHYVMPQFCRKSFSSRTWRRFSLFPVPPWHGRNGRLFPLPAVFSQILKRNTIKSASVENFILFPRNSFSLFSNGAKESSQSGGRMYLRRQIGNLLMYRDSLFWGCPIKNGLRRKISLPGTNREP